MSKKKRQTVTLLVLCLVLIAAGAGYFLLVRHQEAEKRAEKKAQQARELFQLSSEDIRTVEYQSKKASLSFEKDGKNWKLAKDKSFPLDQDKITDMVDEMTGVSADKTVTTDCDDLTRYDLDKPQLTVAVTDKSGKKTKIYVGMESLSGGGRYAYCDGDEKKIYLIGTSLYSSFDYNLEGLMSLPDIPAVKADKIQYLKVDAKKGKSFEAEYDKKNSPYKDIYGWSVKKPYSQPVAGDKDELQNLFGNYTDMSFDGGVTYKDNASLDKKYGFDDPSYTLTVKTAKKNIVLYFGKKKGSSYYVKKKGQKGVYLMETSNVDKLVSINAPDYVYQRLYPGDQLKLNKMQLSYKGKKYDFDITKKKKKDSDTEYDYTVKTNGKTVDSDTFMKAYSVISYLAPGGNIDKNVQVSGNKPVAQFRFKEGQKDTTVILYPYDGQNLYRVSVNGIMQFTVDKSAVDKVIRQFTSLK